MRGNSISGSTTLPPLLNLRRLLSHAFGSYIRLTASCGWRALRRYAMAVNCIRRAWPLHDNAWPLRHLRGIVAVTTSEQLQRVCTRRVLPVCRSARQIRGSAPRRHRPSRRSMSAYTYMYTYSVYVCTYVCTYVYIYIYIYI